MTIDEAREILEKLIPQPQRGDGKSITHLMITEALNMAIEVLEQPPCEDCISRQAVLEKAVIVPIAKVVTEDKVICRKIVFVEDIQKLPSVTPTYDLEEYSTKLWKSAHERGKAEQKWIPVSERLPEENEYIGDVCKYYLIQDEYGDMHVAHLSNVGWIPINSLKAIGDEVIAWMPLPEPYKAESEDKE